MENTDDTGSTKAQVLHLVQEITTSSGLVEKPAAALAINTAADTTNEAIFVHSGSAADNEPTQITLVKSRSPDLTTDAAVVANSDSLGRISFQGFRNTAGLARTTAAEIEVQAHETGDGASTSGLGENSFSALRPTQQQIPHSA